MTFSGNNIKKDIWNKRPNNPQKETLFIESIPFRETRSYVKRIMNNIWEYRRLYPELKEK